MYINFSKLTISPNLLIALCAIKQKNTDYEISEEGIKELHNLGFTKFIKGKASDSERDRLRISSYGEKYLNNLSYGGDVDLETEKILEWLIKVYKNKPNGIIKNKKETSRRIQWWKEITQIKGNKLVILLSLFIGDTYIPNEGESVSEFMARNSRGVLNNMLDNVCWTPPNNFARYYSLDNSPLYRYYEDNEEWVKKNWIKNNLK